jgi:carnitine O-acetyltransferase
MLDAAPTIPLIRRILRTTYKKLAASEASSSSSTSQEEEKHLEYNGQNDDNNVVQDEYDNDVDAVSNIFANVWSSLVTLETAVRLSKMAQQQFTNLTSQYELRALVFDGFGKKLLKQHAGTGFSSTPTTTPTNNNNNNNISTSQNHADAIIQMALQLAAFRLFQQHGQNKQVATYEAALTRYFLHGRTGTARPVSPASRAFVQAMGGADSPTTTTATTAAEKMQALRLAVQALEEYQEKASNGMCVDRHLFGLSMMMQNDNKDEKRQSPPPRLFHDALYQRSKHWVLSTSNFIFCPGFGPVTSDGLGIGYRIDGDSCMFTVTSRRQNNMVGPFCQHLQQALTEIGQLIILEQEEATATSSSSLLTQE